MVFNYVNVTLYFLEFDVTNYYEIAGMSILILLNFALLMRLLLNFRAIFIWYV